MRIDLRTAASATLLFTVLLLSLPLSAWSAGPVYENHSLMLVKKLTDSELLDFKRQGFDIVHVYENGDIEIVAPPNDRKKLIEAYDAEILIENMEEYYRNRLDPTKDMGGYHTFAEAVVVLEDFAANYPALARLDTIGYSYEGRPILSLKVSDNVEIDEDEPEAMINGMIHAREPIGMEINLYVINYLLTRYGIYPNITGLVDSTEMWFVPIINPDGYVYNEMTNPGGGGMWRKNMTPNGDGTYGTDLNRNWGYAWGYDDINSSPITSTLIYRGSGPFSEPETQIMRDFILSRDFAVIINYHSYSGYYCGPWGYIGGIPNPDLPISHEIMTAMAAFNGYAVYSIPGAGVNGGARDWQYGEQALKKKNFSVLPEVGTSFWPPPNEIPGLCTQHLNSTFTAFRKAQFYWDRPTRSLGGDSQYFYLVADSCSADSSLTFTFTNLDNVKSYTLELTLEDSLGLPNGISMIDAITVLAPHQSTAMTVTMSPSELGANSSVNYNYSNLKAVISEVADPSVVDTLTFALILVVPVADADGDGYTDGCDNCTNTSNSDQLDSDGDNIGDVCDNCDQVVNVDQADVDEDGYGDLCDNCPDVYNPGQEDANGNDIGDVCDWICGDIDNNGTINILDVVYLVNYKFKSGSEPEFMDAADVNHDTSVNILDIVYLVNYKFKNGPDPSCL